MKKLSRIMACVIAAVLLSSTTAGATTHGDANLFYFSGSGDQLEEGTTYYIRVDLNAMNYNASRHMNYSKSSILSLLGSSEVFHVLAHGSSSGYFCIGASNSGVTLSYTDIANQYSSLAGLRFVFLECCNIGYYPTFQDVLFNRGVSSSLAFKGTITASTSGNGIHYFAEKVYYYALQGYTLGSAALYAKAATYSQYGYYYGCDNYRLFGINTTLL